MAEVTDRPTTTRTRKPRAWDVFTVTISFFALVVSGAAGVATYWQGQEQADVDRLERVRDSLRSIGALAPDLASTELETQNGAIEQVRLLAAAAADRLGDSAGDLSAIELMVLADALTASNQYQEARRLFGLALARSSEPRDRFEVLTRAALADYFTDRFARGRKQLDEALRIATTENFGGEVSARFARGRVLETRLQAELLTNHCGEADKYYAIYLELADVLVDLAPRVEEFGRRVQACGVDSPS